MQNSIYISNSTDPYYNLALEEQLFERQSEGVAFYLWQNQNTVVIGKNQNAWRECRVSLLEQEGGRLARRPSGGGAVFHDLGNLNFTFVLPREDYDVERQLMVIKDAVFAFGIKAEFSGRNDLIEQNSGAKFSGNAFRFSKTMALHHGTLLVDVDMAKLTRYLAPPPEKLLAKGITSVRSRVINLKELAPEISIDLLKRALIDAFVKAYGPARLRQLSTLNGEKLAELTERNNSWEWRMGKTPSFDVALENRFDWGFVELQLSLRAGHVVEAAAYSDAMDEALIGRIAPALVGCEFRSPALAQRVLALENPQAAQLADWIMEKGF